MKTHGLKLSCCRDNHGTLLAMIAPASPPLNRQGNGAFEFGAWLNLLFFRKTWCAQVDWMWPLGVCD